jgi:hypothetical protein
MSPRPYDTIATEENQEKFEQKATKVTKGNPIIVGPGCYRSGAELGGMSPRPYDTIATEGNQEKFGAPSLRPGENGH